VGWQINCHAKPMLKSWFNIDPWLSQISENEILCMTISPVFSQFLWNLNLFSQAQFPDVFRLKLSVHWDISAKISLFMWVDGKHSMVMLNPPQGWIMLSYCLGSFCPDKAVVNGLVCCNCKCIIQDHSLVIMQATIKKTEKKCCLSTFPDMPLIAQCLWGSLSLKASSITFSSPWNTATVSSCKLMNWGFTYQMETTYILTCWGSWLLISV